MVPSANWMEYRQALLAPSETARTSLTALAGLRRGQFWPMQGVGKESYVRPFTLWNRADTLHQTHPPAIAVLKMTDEGRTEDMDPSPILGGLGCSEKGRVFGTSFAVRWLLGAHSASSILGHHYGQVNMYQRGATHNIRCFRLFICADFTGPVSRGFLW